MMKKRTHYTGEGAATAMIQQRPMYASDDEEDESDNTTVAERMSSLNHALHDQRNSYLADDNHSDEASEIDDEMMNPYVMNPFRSVMDSAALMPPSMSMELGTVSSTSTLHNQRQPLDAFDPYSPTRGSAQRKKTDDMQLELEEETIDFMSTSKSNSSQKTIKNKFTMFGPLVHEQQTPEEREDGGFEDCESSFADSTSFSPVFPNNHNSSQKRQSHYSNASAEYGEAMPLSGNHPSTARRRKHQYYHGQGVWGTIKALIGDVTSSITGNHMHSNPFSQSSSHSSRWNIGGSTSASRRQYSRHSWIAHIRLLVVVLATIFALSTMTMMRNFIFSEIDTSSSVVKYQGEAEAAKEATMSNGKPDSLVIKKIEDARLKAREKKHWWNKKVNDNIEEKGTSTLNGENQYVKVDDVSNETENNNAKSHNVATTATDKDALQGVIVETAEDGTLLIKLPPPQLHLPSASIASPLTSSENRNSKEEDPDETVLIKLPYPKQGRALSEKSTRRNNMKFNQLPPFMKHSKTKHPFHLHEEEHDLRVLESLRSEFDSWISRHKKTYSSHSEKEHRFQIWKSSHYRIQKKNKLHGPCRLTGVRRFGHGPFSDLSPKEFRDKYLSGYSRPREIPDTGRGESAQVSGTTRSISLNRRTTGEIMPPALGSVKRHPTIQRKLEAHVGVSHEYQASFLSGCRSWIDVSCILRKVYGYATIGGTREPVYDENTYPSSIDWRAMGIISSVHSQQTCGACWAITAVETVESAYAMSIGRFVDLDEEEVIACDGTCQMCDGGWPQNAYEYVMKHDGLPQKSKDYDADFLLTLTSVINNESEEVSEYDMSNYFAQICPAGSREGEGGSQSGSGDTKNSGTDSGTRYGKIKGYGYATDRCICYTDGTGCDCDQQNEKTAVLNIASYGPAAVCLEASEWADYSGGIITSDSVGCSAGFQDMNHCVEVVGYAFTDASSNEDKDANSHESGSADNSRDGGKREGYWIVKNQWSTYWGMGGYAYVAMGENTCGILNDMTQVYMDDNNDQVQ